MIKEMIMSTIIDIQDLDDLIEEANQEYDGRVQIEEE
jgi:hypothetical protein